MTGADIGGAIEGSRPSRPDCIGFAMSSWTCPLFPYAIESLEAMKVSVPALVVPEAILHTIVLSMG